MKLVSEHRATAVALCAVLAAILLVPIGCAADGAPTEGECGDDLTWSLDAGLRVLTVLGTGEMDDYTYGTAPWYGHRDTIREIEFGMGCTHIGDYAFANLRCETLSLPASLEGIGECAFERNDFSALELPYRLEIVEDGAFKGCAEVRSVSFSSDTVPFLGADSFMLDEGDEHAKGCDVYSVLEEGFMDAATENMKYPPTHHTGHSLVVAVSDSDGLRFDSQATGAYDEGDEVRIVPVLTEGYEFIGWSDGLETMERTIVFSGDAVYVASAAPLFTLTLYADGSSETPRDAELRYGGETIPVGSLDMGEKAGFELSGVEFQGRFHAIDRTIEMPYCDATATGVWTEAPAPAGGWMVAIIACAVCAATAGAALAAFVYIGRTG